MYKGGYISSSFEKEEARKLYFSSFFEKKEAKKLPVIRDWRDLVISLSIRYITVKYRVF